MVITLEHVIVVFVGNKTTEINDLRDLLVKHDLF